MQYAERSREDLWLHALLEVTSRRAHPREHVLYPGTRDSYHQTLDLLKSGRILRRVGIPQVLRTRLSSVEKFRDTLDIYPDTVEIAQIGAGPWMAEPPA